MLTGDVIMVMIVGLNPSASIVFPSSLIMLKTSGRFFNNPALAVCASVIATCSTLFSCISGVEVFRAIALACEVHCNVKFSPLRHCISPSALTTIRLSSLDPFFSCATPRKTTGLLELVRLCVADDGLLCPSSCVVSLNNVTFDSDSVVATYVLLSERFFPRLRRRDAGAQVIEACGGRA